ncbi:MAG TPA: TlpA disulfide reductase family protein [Ignavibacteria bacterium]
MKKIFLVVAILFAFSYTLKAQNYSDFTLSDLSGNDITLSKLLEKGPVMLSFWASWCDPCKEEMRHLKDIYEIYKDKGFTYLAINEDDQKSIAKVKSFIESKDYKFTVVMDTENKVYEAYWGNTELTLPFSLLISKDKQILAKHSNFLAGDEVKIEEEIKEALGIK